MLTRCIRARQPQMCLPSKSLSVVIDYLMEKLKFLVHISIRSLETVNVVLTCNSKMYDISISIIHSPVRISDGVGKFYQVSECSRGHNVINLVQTNRQHS